MGKVKTTRKPRKPKAEWTPANEVCEPLPVSESIWTDGPGPSTNPMNDAVDYEACTSDHVYETKGDSPAVVTRGDIARMTLDYVLPVAAEACEEGIVREKMLERDARHSASTTYWLVEVEKDTYETTSRLPHGMPPMRFMGKPSHAHWEYVQHMERYRIARGEASRKIAREATFLVAGKGVQT